MYFEVRKTGGGEFYIVSVDKDGLSKEIHQNGSLLTFKTSKEVKDAIRERNGDVVLPTDKDKRGGILKWR